MKILDAKIDWMLGFANNPSLYLLTEGVPIQKLKYQERDHCYFAECEGYVSFFYYCQPGEGYAGRSFDITLTDGTAKTLRGPWSSSTGAMQTKGFPPSFDAGWKDVSERQSWDHYKERGGGAFNSGHFLYDIIIEAIEKFCPEADTIVTETSCDILAYKDTDGQPLVDKILDTAGQKGTGKWTVISSQDLGIPITHDGVTEASADQNRVITYGISPKPNTPVVFDLVIVYKGMTYEQSTACRQLLPKYHFLTSPQELSKLQQYHARINRHDSEAAFQKDVKERVANFNSLLNQHQLHGHKGLTSLDIHYILRV